MMPALSRPRSLLSLAVLAAGAAALAQISGDTPPIKMGLWQTEVTTTTSGMDGAPAGHMAGGSRTTKTQSCLTPETWKKSIADFNSRQKDNNCAMSNVRQDAAGISFDEACQSSSYSSTVHFEASFDASDKMHGSAKMVMTIQGMPQTMTMNMSLTSTYLGADCGDVQPGAAKVVK